MRRFQPILLLLALVGLITLMEPRVAAWAIQVFTVRQGGTGAGTFASNGVLLGNTTSPITATAAGTADQVLRVPGGGGAPAFGALSIDQTAAVTGTLGAGNGGTGTTSFGSAGNVLFAGSLGTSISNSGNFTIDTSTGVLTSMGSAPQLSLTDSTASAKDLVFKVDGDKGQLREAAGADGSLLVLDLANNRVGVGASSPTGALDVRGDEVRIWTGSGTDTNALASGELYVEGDLEVDGNTFLTALTATAAASITGSSDAIQLRLIGNSTQTNPILLVEKSDGTDRLGVSSAGVHALNVIPSTSLLSGDQTEVITAADSKTHSEIQLITGSSTNAFDSSELVFVRARGSLASPTRVADNDTVGGIQFRPYDTGTSDFNQQTAEITCEVDGAASAGVIPTALFIKTSPTTFSGSLTRLAIKPDGKIVVGVDQTPAGLFMVDGSSDIIQCVIQGHSTQTSNILVVEKSDGSDLLTVSNSTVTCPNSFAVTGQSNNAVNLGHGTVSQATNINTNVSVGTASGVITTQSASTAANTMETGFTVTCGACGSGSTVHATVTDYSGTLMTNGFPVVYVNTVSNGSFTLKVGNIHTTNALSGTMKIRYSCL